MWFQHLHYVVVVVVASMLLLPIATDLAKTDFATNRLRAHACARVCVRVRRVGPGGGTDEKGR